MLRVPGADDETMKLRNIFGITGFDGFELLPSMRSKVQLPKDPLARKVPGVPLIGVRVASPTFPKLSVMVAVGVAKVSLCKAINAKEVTRRETDVAHNLIGFEQQLSREYASIAGS